MNEDQFTTIKQSPRQATTADVEDLCDEIERLRLISRPWTYLSFALGDMVRKTRGSSWNGRVVGLYSTSLTAEGYAVESEREPGSVQIYPASALEKTPNVADERQPEALNVELLNV